MKEKFGTIAGIILFIFVVAGILYVSFYKPEDKKNVITEILIEGNKILSAVDYLKGTDLNDASEYPDLTLQKIKSRIMKHPYLKKAEVQLEGKDKVVITVFEKDFMAVLLTENYPYLITQNYELIKLESNSDISKMPVISNAGLTKAEVDSEHAKDSNLFSALKIIDATKIVSETMLNDLTGINLRYGGDIVLMFSHIKCPVIFGKGSEGNKIVALYSIWEGLKTQEEPFKNSSYVDLRFNNEIFIGKTES
jgi:hypothetical protein